MPLTGSFIRRALAAPRALPSTRSAIPILAAALAWLLLVPALAPPAAAQLAGPGELPPIDAATRAAIVDSVTAAIDSIYVLEEPARRIVAGLRQNLADGAYDNLADPAAFARRLHEDAQAINHDGHFGIGAMRPLDPAVAAAQQDEDPADAERQRRVRRVNNYSFRKAEILPGGVGYLRFDGFLHGDDAFAAAAAAMNFISNCDAVILDLRYNGGGSASMIRFICGYLFPEETHLINWDIRAEKKTVQSYSADYVPGRRLTEQPLYILTSGNTFSAAEEFTFDLKNLERATVVGETTGGGGHTVAGYVFDFDGFRIGIRIPYGRAYNPENNEGWEGVGITPHIAVPVEQALDAAHADALRTLIEAEQDAEYRFRLEWAAQDIESRLNTGEISKREMRKLVGRYGPRRVFIDDDALWYQREDGEPHRLARMGDNLFRVGDLDWFRISFERDGSGRAVRIVGHYNDGRTDGNDRGED
ncbi:MAG: S41 family peptidase [Candidatus Krumholzibacteriota bacterium]|nr:S41 family peptidase [Candidatus Krumholzibacteriota bacterium]